MWGQCICAGGCFAVKKPDGVRLLTTREESPSSDAARPPSPVSSEGDAAFAAAYRSPTQSRSHQRSR